MPVQFIKRLILVSAEKAEFKSKNQATFGETVTGWNYVFVDKEMKPVRAFDKEGKLKDNVETISAWDDEKAKNYIFEINSFGKEKLII